MNADILMTQIVGMPLHHVSLIELHPDEIKYYILSLKCHKSKFISTEREDV